MLFCSVKSMMQLMSEIYAIINVKENLDLIKNVDVFLEDV